MQRLAEGVVLRLEVAPSVALVRPRFTVGLPPATDQTIHQSEKIGFIAALGGELRFD